MQTDPEKAKQNASKIIRLIIDKKKADPQRQMTIRQQIRDLGFSAENFGLRGEDYSVANFLNAIGLEKPYNVLYDVLLVLHDVLGNHTWFRSNFLANARFYQYSALESNPDTLSLRIMDSERIIDNNRNYEWFRNKHRKKSG